MVITVLTLTCTPFNRVAENEEREMSSFNSGNSYSTAVFIEETTGYRGVAAEYDWLKKNFPGYKVLKQSLSFYENQPYDIFTIRTRDREERDVYFNISSFFGNL